MSTYLRLQPPPGFRPGFFPLQVYINGYPSQKKSGSPTGSRPKTLCYSQLCIAPPPWWRRALRHPALFFRPQQPIFILFLLVHCIWLYIPLPPVHLSAWPSCYLTQCVYRCTPTSVWSLARSHLLSSIPFPYQGPDDSSIARSPSSRFRASGQLIQVQAQLIFGVP